MSQPDPTAGDFAPSLGTIVGQLAQAPLSAKSGVVRSPCKDGK